MSSTVLTCCVTARYLVHKSHIVLAEEELALCSLCLGYLNLPCFDNGITESATRQFAINGHYIFTEYAMAHWADHFLEAARSNGSVDFTTMQVVIESFLHSHCKSTPYKYISSFRKATESALHDEFQGNLSQFIIETLEDLDLPAVLQQIRSVIEIMSASSQTRRALEKMYGPNLYKCSRIDCTQFFDGYPELNDRERHHKYHERKFYCTFEGCIRAQTGSGFADASRLNEHVTRFHDPFGAGAYSLLENTEDDISRAIESSDVVSLKRLCERKFSTKRLFHDSIMGVIHNSQDARYWDMAIEQADDEIISVLASHTEFSRTQAQSTLLSLAVRRRRLDIIRWFIQKEYRRDDKITLKFGSSSPVRKSPPAVAVEIDDVEALRILINSDSKFVLTPYSHEFSSLITHAARSGSLSCVRYFISEIGPRPCNYLFSPIERRTAKVQQKHSMLYIAIEAGQTAICRYILSVTNSQDLHKTEGLKALACLASNNGHEQILKLLVERDDQLQPSIEASDMARAKLYNELRYGRQKEYIHFDVSISSLDEPDVNGCSLLMYAALNGHSGAVQHLLDRGADYNREGWCTEVSATEGRNQTALILAVHNGHVDVVRQLLQCANIQLHGYLVFRHGTSRLNKKKGGWDENRVRVKELAERRQFPKIVEMLAEHGRKVTISAGDKS